MRVLFLDKYLPGPFRHVPAALSVEGSVFLSEHRRRDTELPGVTHVQVRVPRAQPRGGMAENLMNHLHRRAEAFAQAMRQLKASGFLPEVICLNGSSGCGFYAADIFPGVPRLGRFEWYYSELPSEPAGDTPDAALRVRNLFQLQMLHSVDALTTGTNWQRNSYPEPWRSRMRVIPEGVDTAWFTPGASSVHVGEAEQPCELVTYIARTLTPDGGCGRLCRALPPLFAARPGCHVLMVGHPRATDKEANAYEELLAGVVTDRSRIHFKRFCSYEEYRAILRASSAHVFLSTGPVVASGLLEAMSCGCLIVASDLGPVREILQPNRNALLVPSEAAVSADAGEVLARTLLTALAGGPGMEALRHTARADVVAHFSHHDNAARYAELLTGLAG